MAGFLPQLPIKKESIKTQGYHWETIEMNLTKKVASSPSKHFQFNVSPHQTSQVYPPLYIWSRIPPNQTHFPRIS